MRGCYYNIIKRQQSKRGFTGSASEVAGILATSGSVEQAMENFLATGTAPNVDTLGIMQVGVLNF